MELSAQAQSLKLGIYQHFKGHLCKVLGVACHSEDPNQEFVVYNHDGNLWIRPLGMFLENVEKDGYKGPRFKYIND